jgi:hypothetical protein
MPAITIRRVYTCLLMFCLPPIAPGAFAEVVGFSTTEVVVITASTCGVPVGPYSSNANSTFQLDTNTNRISNLGPYSPLPNLPSGLFIGSIDYVDQWGNTRRGLLDTSKHLALEYHRTNGGYPACTTSSTVQHFLNEPAPVDLEPEDISFIRATTNWVRNYINSRPKNQNSKPVTRNACMCVRG